MSRASRDDAPLNTFDDTTAEFLRDFMAELQGFITRVYTVLPRNA